MKTIARSNKYILALVLAVALVLTAIFGLLAVSHSKAASPASLEEKKAGWYAVRSGAVDLACNGVLQNKFGSWFVEDGKVTGVKAVKYDGTEVTAHATKGVILATGGYAANIPMVLSENVYWSSDYLTNATKTTNRSSLRGDAITMAQAVGADVTGLGFTQLMPISWVDNGNLAFGGGNYACWINPTTGHRFVDEGSERDVLSLAEFRNGVEVNGTKGVFLEFYNAEEKIPGPIQLAEGDYEGRYYRRTIDQLPELLQHLGMEAD